MKKWSIKWFNEYYYDAKKQGCSRLFLKTLKKLKRGINKSSENDLQNYVSHIYNYISNLLLQDSEKVPYVSEITMAILSLGEIAKLSMKRNDIMNDIDLSDIENYINEVIGNNDDENDDKEPVIVGAISTGNMNSTAINIGSILGNSNSIPSVPKIKSKLSNKIEWICNEPMTFNIEKNGQLWFNNECWDYLFRTMYSEACANVPIIKQRQLMRELLSEAKIMNLNLGFNNKDIVLCFDKGPTNVKSIEFITKYDALKKPFGFADMDKLGTMLFYINDESCGQYILEPSDVPGCLYGKMIDPDKASTKNVITIK